MKIVIADRDDLERKGIKWLLSTNQIPYQEVEEISGGVECLNTIISAPPDLLIVELEMFDNEQMEKLIRIVKMKHIACFVHTSQKTFYSAYQALNLKAEALFVKPLQTEEWIRVLRQFIRVFGVKSAPKDIHYEGISHTEEVIERLFGYGSETNGTQSSNSHLSTDRVVVVEVDENRENRAVHHSHKLLERIKAEMVEYKPLITRIESQLILLFDSSNLPIEPDPITSLEKIWISFCERLKNEGNVSVTIGIGNRYDNPRYLNQSYIEAKKALEQRFFFGGNQVFSARNPFLTYQFDPFLSPVESKELTDFLSNTDRQAIKDWLYEKFGKFPNSNGYFPEPETLRIRLTSVLAHIRRFMIEKKSILIFEDHYHQVFQQILNGGTLQPIVQEILYFCYQLCDWVDKEEDTYQSYVIKSSKDFIDIHFNESIKLQDLSDRVNRNPHYISHLFKQVTGETFKEYLQQKRIEEAEKLLLKTNFSLTQIARKVGYQDQNYFCRVFKRKNKMSPSLWRSKNNDKT